MNDKPKIAIIGYGAMGKEIESACQKRQLQITDIFDIADPINPNKAYDFDVAIDFTFPNSVCENVKILTEMKKNIVLGTTGWYDNFEFVKSMVDSSGVGFVYDTNFSIGMNIFQKIIEQAAKLIDNFDDYDIALSEIHHKRKKDHPSGTAITLAEIILNNLKRKEKYSESQGEDAICPKTLHINALRIGDVTGTHTIMIDSPADTIELTHKAKNRSGLANGAVMAAEWIFNKQGFYKFSDVISAMM